MKTKISVYGMHCKACELLIENKISEIDGVKLESISQKNNYIEIEYESDKNLKDIKNAIDDLGYSTTKVTKKGNSLFDYIIIVLIFIIFGIFYLLLKDIKFFNDILKNGNLNFLMILLIGLVASLSSCLAVTGGIVIGFAKYIDTSKSNFEHFKVQFLFHLGRILGFSFLGGILGSMGGYVGSFGMLNKVLLAVAGIFMLFMGLNLLSILNFKLSINKFLGNKILSIKKPIFAPIIGALTFFLPCGFTQSMQVYATSSGGFLSGAMIMGFFAIGTLPVLFLVGYGSSYFKDKNFNYINKVIGVLVIYFAIFIISGLLNMFNLNFSKENNYSNNINVNLTNIKEVKVIHNGSGFKDIILEGANSYKIEILPESDGLGCMFALTIPGIDENEYPVKKGVPIIININNPKPGKYKAVCTAMGMKHGNIIIK